MNQSRRSFLGLISAVSAAVASGVRIPASTEVAAAGTAPVKGRIKPVVSVEATKLERDLRKLLEQYIVIETEGMQCFDGPTHWRVVYRKGNGATSPLDAQKPNWDHLRPTRIAMQSDIRNPWWPKSEEYYSPMENCTIEVTWA